MSPTWASPGRLHHRSEDFAPQGFFADPPARSIQMPNMPGASFCLSGWSRRSAGRDDQRQEILRYRGSALLWPPEIAAGALGAERAEAMNARPGKGKPRAPGTGIEIGCGSGQRLREEGEWPFRRLTPVPIGAIDQITATHQPKMCRPGTCEGDIAAAGGGQASLGSGFFRQGTERRQHGLGEACLALRREGGDEPALVAEMRRGGRMRNTGPARAFAQSHGLRPILEHDFGHRIEQCASQRPVVVAAFHLCGHGHEAMLAAKAKLDNGEMGTR